MTGHWRSRIDTPHPLSYLAFLLGVHQLVELEDGPQPSLWGGPIPLEDCDPAHRAYWAHWNPVLEAFENALIDGIKSELAPLLAAPMTFEHPSVAPLVSCMLHGRRTALMVADSKATVDTAPLLAKFPVKPAWAFVYLLKERFRGAEPAATDNALNQRVADYLSRGIPRGHSRYYATTRNHVARACKSFLTSLRGRVNSAMSGEAQTRILEATFLLWNSRLAAIEEIATAASAATRFRGKTGAELVEAIDHAHGLHRVFYRVLNGEHRRRSA